MSSAQWSMHAFDQPEVLIEQMIRNVEKVMIGKRTALKKALIAILSGGHLLLEDVPGTGKTRMVKALAKTAGCSFKRIQFTPDMLPSDVTGLSIYNQKTGEFEFRPGPIMAQIVLADEINRTSPKTQAALLEAMEERHVTAEGTSYALPAPFMVLATQNPLDFEGTYVLPEAQLDRFQLKIRLGYPNCDQESEMLGRLQESDPLDAIQSIITADELIDLQRRVRRVHVDDLVKRYIVELADATRHHPDIAMGVSPRASLALMRAAQAEAFMAGRPYVIPDDVKSLAQDVFAHRLILNPEARLAAFAQEQTIEQLVNGLAVPKRRVSSGAVR